MHAVHVIVDNVGIDLWAVTAAVAAVVAAIVGVFALLAAIGTLRLTARQTRLAKDALEAAKEELKLAKAQLVETENATRQTQEALELGRLQLEAMQKADLDRARALAPQITARMELGASSDRYVMHLANVGGIAYYLIVTGYSPDGNFHNPFRQKLDPGEDLILSEFYVLPAQASYCQKIRIRARDVLGNKYITEYNSLGASLAYPVFREPWLGKEVGAPRPARCSEEVSWAVEHFERRMNEPDELVEQGFDINAPA
jgi:hypothetical protein